MKAMKAMKTQKAMKKMKPMKAMKAMKEMAEYHKVWTLMNPDKIKAYYLKYREKKRSICKLITERIVHEF